MKESSVVCLTLYPEEDQTDAVFCNYDPKTSKFTKLPKFNKKLSNWTSKDFISWFLNTDLPYITHQDANPFELFDDECESMSCRVFRYKDCVLHRDVVIPSDLGSKSSKERLEKVGEHQYLPGNPSLVYENYPFFKPDPEGSVELSDKEFSKRYVSEFEKMVAKMSDNAFESVAGVTDVVMYQAPVTFESFFSVNYGLEFYDTFNSNIFSIITGIYSKLPGFSSEKALRKFVAERDNHSYIAEDEKLVLSPGLHCSLKSIGSVATSGFAFGIADVEHPTLLKQLWCHVEIVPLNMAVGEGYELYMKTKKQNFKEEHLIGNNSTKINNFLKTFSKCVSICLNSRIDKFIITDYYWCGCFKLNDIKDFEIFDVKKLFAKVKLTHFSLGNYEANDEKLTIRKIIASFMNTTPTTFNKTFKAINELNKQVLKEWKAFKNLNSYSVSLNSFNNSEGPLSKKTKKPNSLVSSSKYLFKLSSNKDAISFYKQPVSIEKAFVNVIAIGYLWSCQTLVVNINKLFINRSYYNGLNYKGDKQVLVSIYDPQYIDVDRGYDSYYANNVKLITPKINKYVDFTNYLDLSVRDGMEDIPYLMWLTSVESYRKLETLQGDCLAKVIDFGYLEDQDYNMNKLHFKSDGYYLIYEPISHNSNDLKPVDSKNIDHYKLCKETLHKLHENDVTFNPFAKLTSQIFKIFNNKAYIINLEGTSYTKALPQHIKRDLMDLDFIFSQKSDLSYIKIPAQDKKQQIRRLSSAAGNNHHHHISRSRLGSSSSHFSHEPLLMQGFRASFNSVMDTFESSDDEELDFA